MTISSNLHLLTLDQLTSNQYLIRLERFFELNEDPIYSQPIQIDLQLLFESLGEIMNVTEMILTANRPFNQINHLFAIFLRRSLIIQQLFFFIQCKFEHFK